jgi:hypothetical protein
MLFVELTREVRGFHVQVGTRGVIVRELENEGVLVAFGGRHDTTLQLDKNQYKRIEPNQQDDKVSSK